MDVLISNAWAQAAPAAAGTAGAGASFMQFLPLIGMLVILYFIMIRPQIKKQKEHQALVNALAAGDEVVTSAGMVGKVTKVDDSYATVQVAQGVEVRFQKVAIVQVLPKGSL